MSTMTIFNDGYIFRWAGGSFISVWQQSRADERVPDDMIELPASLNRSKATRTDIECIVSEYRF